MPLSFSKSLGQKCKVQQRGEGGSTVITVLYLCFGRDDDYTFITETCNLVLDECSIIVYRM